MPRENRKRGKKHKKTQEEESYNHEEPIQLAQPVKPEFSGEPSWIVPATNQAEEINLEAPFGYVEVDVKAYFRTVDQQMRDWQTEQAETLNDDEDTDPNEQRRLFFMAALTEMHGKEKQLATDPDCSVILERMSYSMDDFVRRVFVDSLSGSYQTLAKHRFASHVCQTLFAIAKDTISRETKGIFPTVPDSQGHGELLTLTQLVLDISEELLPVFPSLIVDPFGSHVARSLLLLLSPNLSASEDSTQSTIRSKKSANWKAKQGPMKSVFGDEKGKGKEASATAVPSLFPQMARKLVEIVKEQLDENEVRAMAASKVASPGLKLLLEVEADQGMCDEPGSLMDRVMVGLITSCREDPSFIPEESDYLGTLLRDTTSSHLLETIVSRCPEDAFNTMWKVYFKGKLARLSFHPVANFVVAKAFERVSLDQLSEACTEVEGGWGKIIRASRTGVLRAIIDRAATLGGLGKEVCEAVCSGFDLLNEEDHLLLVPCVLSLLPLQEYKTALGSRKVDTEKSVPGKRYDHQGARSDPLEPKIQGAVLLQSLLRLPDVGNKLVLDSINSLSINDRIRIAHHPAGSRVYDILLESPTVPSKAKRQFVMDFIGHYQVLVDDKIGSRVGDRCWFYADTYLKEKIARSMFAHEQTLAASYYGKYFSRNLNLYLLQRKPEEWRNMQSDRKRLQDQKAQPSMPTLPQTESAPQAKPEKSRKRKAAPEDEIDALFEATLGKKVKKAALVSDNPTSTTKVPMEEVSKRKDKKDKKDKKGDELDDVLLAIRAAPGGEEKSHKKKRKI